MGTAIKVSVALVMLAGAGASLATGANLPAVILACTDGVTDVMAVPELDRAILAGAPEGRLNLVTALPPDAATMDWVATFTPRRPRWFLAPPERVTQLINQLVVKRIQCLRPIQRHQPDLAVRFNQNIFVLHLGSSSVL